MIYRVLLGGTLFSREKSVPPNPLGKKLTFGGWGIFYGFIMVSFTMECTFRRKNIPLNPLGKKLTFGGWGIFLWFHNGWFKN